MECTTNCLSKRHGNYLTSAFTKEDIETLKSIVKQRCSNPFCNSDEYGRSVLHISASVGHYEVLQWLCDELKNVNILHRKDKESGWTALHRSVYYGQIDCALLIHSLIQDWNAVDSEGYSALDLVVFDSPRVKRTKKKKERLAVVVLPFQSGEAGELTMHVGDIIEIVSSNTNGWGVGKLQSSGAKGLFPINFVEETKEAVVVDHGLRIKPVKDIYVWGNNVNFGLGLGDSKNRSNPELIESLWKEHCDTKDCIITKFHSVFLTESGNIFTCGHGVGGRLGHGNEEPALYPTMVEYFKDIHCIAIDAAYFHTIVLDELGRTYTFGFNDFHQLGHYPPPLQSLSPKQIIYKPLKNRTVIGVAAGRFHSVIYTKNEIYTFGLNAGQLGHPKGEKLITNPKLVSNLYKKDISISQVVASDGATVSFLTNGDLYLFQDYVSRRIASRMFDVSSISVTGGVLQCDHLGTFNKPEPLRIAVLHDSGIVGVWGSGFNSFKPCYWLGQKLLHAKIIHVSLGKHLTVVTDSGQTYLGYFLKTVASNVSDTNNNQMKVFSHKVEVQATNFTLSEIIERNRKARSDCVEVNLVKVPLLYRCLKCYTDSKSRSFAAIQYDARIGLTNYPNVRNSSLKADLKTMFTAATLSDEIHDCVIKTSSGIIPVHKFILRSRFEPHSFNAYETKNSEKKTMLTFPCEDHKVVQSWLEEVYIQNDTTQLPLTVDKTTVNKRNSVENLEEFDVASFVKTMESVDLENPLDDDSFNQHSSKKKRRSKKKSAYAVHLENRSSHEVILFEQSVMSSSKPPRDTQVLNSLIDWKKYKDLSDIKIESEDGRLFYCHKCVLVGRSEYFHHMLSKTWLEASLCHGGSVKIPCPGNVLDIVLNYLYTDEADALKQSYDTTFIGEILVFADQLLLSRLKDICELELADKVNLRNAVDIFEFSCHYGVLQLQIFVCQFLSFNLPYFLESGLLAVLDKDCLGSLSKEYRKLVEGMKGREIRPSVEHRRIDEAEKLLQETIVNDLNKIKSRRGRLSSSASKSISSSMSESDTCSHSEASFSIHELPNDVFDENNSPRPAKNPPSPTKPRRMSDEKRTIALKDGESHTCYVNGFNSQNSVRNSTKNDHTAWDISRDVAMLSHDPKKEDPPLPQTEVDVTPKRGSYSNPFKKKSQKELKYERTRTSSNETSPTQSSEKPTVCPWAPQAQSSEQGHCSNSLQKVQQNKQKQDPHVVSPCKPVAEEKQSVSVVRMTQSSHIGNSNPFKKMSQKERKHERTRTLSMENQSEERQPIEVKSSCPWGVAPQKTTSVKSFRDLLNEERPSLENRPESISHSVAPKVNKRGNPWGSVAVRNNENVEADGFVDILNVQKEEKKNLSEQAKKPLSTIQIEERAIEELKRFYQLRAQHGEYVSVKRVKPVVATPFWEVVIK